MDGLACAQAATMVIEPRQRNPVSSLIRNKWLAFCAVLLTLAGVERITEWYLYGYATKQGLHMPRPQEFMLW